MGAGPSDRTHRRIQAICATGTPAALGDAELLRRFATGRGLEREDAFAVLASRHGPMVLSVCRRMLRGDRDGADDAFQAVFLVLARKAGSLRRPDDLRPWLYGVAVRAGKEARRRSARIHAREGGTLADHPAAATVADPLDLRAAVDEELERLPGRYREPILLCELEGASRRDAAERLGLAEGTLSSRLARGKALLRDRLTRRGLAVGTLPAAFAPTVDAARFDVAADAVARLASESPFARGATETASVAGAIAAGVLAMPSVARIQALAAVAAAVLGLLTLSVGLARGLPEERFEPRAAAPTEAPPTTSSPSPSTGETRLRGVVVDEAGRPLAGAEARLWPFTLREVVVVTGPDGAYEFPPAGSLARSATILARSADGRLLGSLDFKLDASPAATERPGRIVAKPAREVDVRVVDPAGKPVAGALVEAAGDLGAAASATTNDAGEVRLAIPADRRVQWIVTKKSGVGLDYAEFGHVDSRGRCLGVDAGELPPSVGLTPGSPRTVRIKALDEDGKPIAGLPYGVWLLRKDARRSEVNYSGRLPFETTGPDGIAVFDWLPGDSKEQLIFWPESGRGFATRRVEVEPGQSEAETRPTRNAAIQGRATLPDGSPARGAFVEADGTGRGSDRGHGEAVTAADGSYRILVPPDEAYAVHVEHPDWAAPARMDVVFPRGRALPPIDFPMTRGTVLKGRATKGPDDLPATGDHVMISQRGGETPEETRPRQGGIPRIQWGRSVRVDEQGRYEARLSPGKYVLYLSPVTPARGVQVEVEIPDDAPELVRDFHRLDMKRGPIAGRVVDRDGAPVAGAFVELPRADLTSASVRVTTDDDGRFASERWLRPEFLFAADANGSRRALAEIGPDDAEVVLTLAPAATVSGRVLDQRGEPARRRGLVWTLLLPNEKEYDDDFAPDVFTDDDGRFTLPSLFVGRDYDLRLSDDFATLSVGRVRVDHPGPVDLGTLRAKVERGE